MCGCIIDTRATVYTPLCSLAPKATSVGANIKTLLLAQIDASFLRHMHDNKISSLNARDSLITRCISREQLCSNEDARGGIAAPVHGVGMRAFLGENAHTVCRPHVIQRDIASETCVYSVFSAKCEAPLIVTDRSRGSSGHDG
jgi:hypothetical protein